MNRIKFSREEGSCGGMIKDYLSNYHFRGGPNKRLPPQRHNINYCGQSAYIVFGTTVLLVSPSESNPNVRGYGYHGYQNGVFIAIFLFIRSSLAGGESLFYSSLGPCDNIMDNFNDILVENCCCTFMRLRAAMPDRSIASARIILYIIFSLFHNTEHYIIL